MHWQSRQIPSTIRRPWRVFQEDLEYKMADESYGSRALEEQQLAAVQVSGARQVFLTIAENLQRAYAEVSLMELAAYACWCRSRSHTSDTDSEEELEEIWDGMDADDKVEWVPEDPRSALALDACWAPLLVDGPPPCSSPSHGEVHQLQQAPGQADAVVSDPQIAPSSPMVASSANDSKQDDAAGGNTAEGSEADNSPGEGHATADSSAGSTALDGLALACTSRPSEKEDVCPGMAGVEEERAATAQANAARKALAQLFGTLNNGKSRQPLQQDTADPEFDEMESLQSPQQQPQERTRVPRRASGGGTHRARQRHVSHAARKAARHKLAVLSSRAGLAMPLAGDDHVAANAQHPGESQVVCCVCHGNEASKGNDLALCDSCGRGFHQHCHDPPVASFGGEDDPWFCGACTEGIARERGLRLRAGDFAWARVKKQAPFWPAVVLRMDFASAEDRRPYWVQFFVPGTVQEGAWVSESQVKPWAEGPQAAINDVQRQRAVRLAEVAGAPPFLVLSRPSPRTPMPEARGRQGSAQNRRRRRTADSQSSQGSEPKQPRRAVRVASAAFHAPIADLNAEESVANEMQQIQDLLAEAQSRQERLQVHLGQHGRADGLQSESNISESAWESENDMGWPCATCGATFPTKQKLAVHAVRAHGRRRGRDLS